MPPQKPLRQTPSIVNVPASRLNGNDRSIVEIELADRTLERGPSELLVPVDLVEVEIEWTHEIEAGRRGAADRHRLVRRLAHAGDALAKELLQGALLAPLRLVHHIPRDDRRLVTIALDDRPNDQLDQRGSRAGIRDQARASAQRHAAGDPRGRAEMEIQQDRHQSHAVPARRRDEGVEVGEDLSVQTEWHAGRVEVDAGSRVTEQEGADQRDAIASEFRERALQQIARRRLRAQAAVRIPGAGANVGPIANPRQVGADDETIHAGEGHAALRASST